MLCYKIKNTFFSYYEKTKVMRLKHIFLILTACMLMTSCIQRTKVTGTIEHCKESYAMLYKMHPYGLEFQDTVLLIKGRFTQHLDTGVNIYILRFNDTCLASFITTTGSEINITAQSPAINHTLTVTGNKESELLMASRRQLLTLENQVQALSEQFIAQQQSEQLDSLDMALQEQFNTYFEAHRAYLEQFIAAHPDKLASLLAFYQTLGRNQFFSPIEDKAILENLYQHLHKTYPESEYVIDLEEKLGYDE